MRSARVAPPRKQVVWGLLAAPVGELRTHLSLFTQLSRRIVRDWLRSARFCQHSGLALWQPGDHPEIVRQHAPGHLAALIRISLAHEWTAQESILENRDARLGL